MAILVSLLDSKAEVSQMEFHEVEGAVTKHMERLEHELGNDTIPILIIMMCRFVVKYRLDIDWIVGTIRMGYRNETPPDIDDDVTHYDS
jgi:hypothetical protein